MIRARQSFRHLTLLLASVVAVCLHGTIGAQTPATRPMTFLDMQLMKSFGSPAVSPDGHWLLYTVSTPDWKEARSQTDIHLVSLRQGLPSTKQMTFTREKNETSPSGLVTAASSCSRRTATPRPARARRTSSTS